MSDRMSPLDYSLKYWEARGFGELNRGDRFVFLRPVWKGGYNDRPVATPTYFNAKDIKERMDNRFRHDDVFVIVNKIMGGWIVLYGYAYNNKPPLRNPRKWPKGLSLYELLCTYEPGPVVDDIGQAFSIGDINGPLSHYPPGYRDKKDPEELGREQAEYIPWDAPYR